MLHGGPIGGLAAWAAERLVTSEVPASPEPLQCARLTLEILAPVRVRPLTVQGHVVKPGSRAMVVDVAISDGDRLVARASTQWLRTGPGWRSDDGPAPPRPDEVADPGSSEFDYPRPGFNCDTAEMRYVEGSNEEPGPGTIWVRLTSPLVAGEELSPLVRVATVADLAAAAAWEHTPAGTAYINPDVTLQLSRYPTGPWLALAARGRRAESGLGYNDAVAFDDQGSFGRILQSLVDAGTSPT